MRWLVALLLLLPAPLAAQTRAASPIPVHAGRWVFATKGPEMMPQMSIDELALAPERYASTPLPAQVWADMKACAAKHGVDVRKAGAPPQVLVVPVARTIRVHDLTVDSLMYATDENFVGEKWSAPTVGYSLVRSGYVLVTDEYRENVYLFRHEALHFILWRAEKVLSHPESLFGPCDKAYE